MGLVAAQCFEKNVDQGVGADPGAIKKSPGAGNGAAPALGKAKKTSPDAGNGAVYKGRHVFLGDSVKDHNFD